MAVYDISYLAAAGGGIASFLSPCVLPLVPAYVCLVAGTSLDQMETRAHASQGRNFDWKILTMAIIFVLGFSTVFVLLGAGASYVNRLLLQYMDILSVIAGGIIILFGVHMTGLVRIPLLYREARFNGVDKPRSWAGVYVIGLAFGFGWTPCIGPILGTILAIAASDSSLSYGVSLLSVYALGLGIPFLIAAAAINPFMRFMKKFRDYYRALEIGTGLIIILTGFLILTGQFQILAYWFLELLPGLASLG